MSYQLKAATSTEPAPQRREQLLLNCGFSCAGFTFSPHISFNQGTTWAQFDLAKYFDPLSGYLHLGVGNLPVVHVLFLFYLCCFYIFFSYIMNWRKTVIEILFSWIPPRNSWERGHETVVVVMSTCIYWCEQHLQVFHCFSRKDIKYNTEEEHNKE